TALGMEETTVRVVVAMSGGVDSSLAAAILNEEGYQVIGVTMQIWPSDKQASKVDRFGGCCGLGAVDDAKMVAHKLGIPHYVMNFRDVFAKKVIADFCQEYSLGRTPNPCIRCNQYIKFDALLKRAKELGADFVATGHYARIEKDEAKGRYLLKKGIDRGKDQSYVLYTVTQEQLRHTLLPIGNFTKQKVREIAGELGLPVAAKPESQEICFIPDDDYPRFLKEYIPQAVKPGPILNEQGNILGRHRGILFYTVGQRKGLGISAKEPLYVIAIEQERNAIVVGSKENIYGNELIASGLNWISIAKLKQPITVKAKTRYRHKEAEAAITPLDEEKVYVKFKEPQMAITPGQAIVFYDGDTVIGGGTIEQARK
ncbi:MAG: tRNA 2-thiouridine(34) synthase MnmA, partial [Dehalococcoidales bacterium]|nr:tRNA 2-thiouridine(34) synthase MnmA [Dehalococcoidales bacterium]